MLTCGQCGRESPDGFGFCPACGAPLAAVPAREVRKVVTVLFCDLTGSTAIGERTDPEALRGLMNRYYDAARTVLERHGGTVEKFVGDAVMAVFGIPTATEDDALRAVRASVELRDVVHELGLEARIGVNTGAVVAGDGDTLVTGDAVNVAARLEQAAGAGEILLGDDTFRLVRDAVDGEASALDVKGKAEPVPAFRLVRLDAAAAGFARSPGAPLVGRGRERERLRADFADVTATRSCRLFTLIGPAGVGKSRVVADFLEEVADGATIARGRALSYGEGITYWPLVEALFQLGVQPGEAIRSSPADTQLATRALLERLAEERPVVLVLDDLHWAEPPLLDLVEHICDWSRGVPILLLCIARPELLDVRPGWAGGKLNATSVLLEPLDESDTAELVERLLDGVELDAATRARIVETAEGNPLFLEEMAALAREAGNGVEVPPTIQALLQARLDTLGAEERTVIERGAVEGKVFHRGAVTALAPEPQREQISGRLLSLVRKELVRPDRTQIPGDDAFRFRHLLIRDTAYESLPKAVRAELHERFAEWLEGHASLYEQDEILGYHLEQAAQYRRELDPDDAKVVELAGRAAGRLGTAGRRAFDRDDMHATRNLLSRAVALCPEAPERRRMLPEFVEALYEGGQPEAADALLTELAAGSDEDRARAITLQAARSPAAAAAADTATLDRAQAVLEAAGDVIGVARCERARGWAAWLECRSADANRAYRRAHDLFLQAGTRALQAERIESILVSATASGAPVAEVLALADELQAGLPEEEPLVASALTAGRARIEYDAGAISMQELEQAIGAHVQLLRETGSESGAVVAEWDVYRVRTFDRDDEAIVRDLTEYVGEMERVGDVMYLANILGISAFHQSAAGQVDAALQTIERGRAVAHPEDIADQVELDLSEAYAQALLGNRDQALELLESVRRRAAGIDLSPVLDRAAYVGARVAVVLGDVESARAVLAEQVRRLESLGYHRIADSRRRDLDALG